MQKSSGKLMILAGLCMLSGLIALGTFIFVNKKANRQSLEAAPTITNLKPQITLLPGKKLTIRMGEQSWQVSSYAATLGEALEEVGLKLNPKDKLSLSLETPLQDGTDLTILKARQVWIDQAGSTLSGVIAANSVGEALAELGLSLQGLDFSEPAEDSPLPADGKIAVHRVSESLSLVKEETPAAYSYEADPETELDQQSTLLPAVPGYVVTRARSRVVDGQAQETLTEGPWKASEPVNGIIGLGSKVVVHTEVVDGVELNYWRKLSVYATGYKPSSNGGTGTASGIPLTKGIIAVAVSWYNSGMAFQKVYVPGYGFGTVADTGPNILGHPWIDLGFDDDNYVSWHNWTTMYLLEPVPAFVPLQMP